MTHYVFTAGTGRHLTIIGIALNTDHDDALRIATGLTDARLRRGVPTEHAAVTFTTVGEVDAPVIDEGDVIPGSVAMTLPRGSAIVRIADIDGIPASPSSALIRTGDGFAAGWGGDLVSTIDEASAYRVLFIGRDVRVAIGARPAVHRYPVGSAHRTTEG